MPRPIKIISHITKHPRHGWSVEHDICWDGVHWNKTFYGEPNLKRALESSKNNWFHDRNTGQSVVYPVESCEIYVKGILQKEN